MSDSLNALIAQGGKPIDVLSQLAQWQDMAKSQAATSLLQQQGQGAGLENALKNLAFQKANYIQGLAGIPTGGVAPSGSLPSQAGVTPASQSASSNGGAPGGAVGSSASSMTFPGQAGFTLKQGLPMPPLLAMTAAQSPEAALQAAEYRRQTVFANSNVMPDQFVGNMQNLYAQGYLTPGTMRAIMQNPAAMQQRMVETYRTPEDYAKAYAEYTNAGVQPDAATGGVMPSAVAQQAKGGLAAAGAAGAKAGALPYVRATARAETAGTGDVTPATITVPVLGADGKPVLDKDGNLQAQVINTNRTSAANPQTPAPTDATNPLLDPRITGVPAAPTSAATAAPAASAGPASPAGQTAPAAPPPSATAPARLPAPQPSPQPVPGVPTGVPVLTPAEQTAQAARTAEATKIADAYGDEAGAVVRAGTNAPQTLARLSVLDNAAQNFRPGASADARLAAAKTAVDALQTFGITPPSDWVDKVAAGETISKEAGFLTAAMTKSLGSREAASVFQSIAAIQPGIKISEGGFPIIVNSIRSGVQRDQDLMNYQEKWLAPTAQGGMGNSTTRGMSAAFNREYPVEAYASRVIPFPEPASGKFIPNVIYRNNQGQAALWDGHAFRPLGTQ